MDSDLMPFQAIKLALARLRHCSNLDDRGVGKLAPIVVVDGNPAAGIRDIHKIEAVVASKRVRQRAYSDFVP
jgi:hypothetical protein